jgi:hypothetical protein
MAIQDYIDGGYIGRLGDTIGQRYRGRYYTRTYTPPRDPRTPAQLANRAIFSQAITLAKQAYNINRGAAYWQRPDMQEFAWRVSTAKHRLQSGMPPEEALPIYPDGYTPEIILPPPTIIWATDTHDHLTLSWPPIADIGGRTLDISIHIWIRLNPLWATVHRTITIPQSGILSVILPWFAGQSYPAGAWIEAISIDDAQPSKPSIQLPRQSFIQPYLPYIIMDSPIRDIEWSATRKVVVIGSYTPIGDVTGDLDYYAESIDPATGKKTTYEQIIHVSNGIVPPVELPWDKRHQYDSYTVIFTGNQTISGQEIEINETEREIDQPYTPAW